MLEIEVQHDSQTITPPVDVLFADCEAAFMDTLSQQLTERKLSWDTASVDELEGRLKHSPPAGAVVFGPSVWAKAESGSLSALLRSLQQKYIAAFFLTCGPAADEYPLTAMIAPGDEDELPGRLETAALYARRHQAEQTRTRLCEDTAEQLEMAGQVQRNFLPSRLPHTEHIRWAAMFRPAQWVSGDIYDIARLDEKHIGFYLADAVGHSMPAALLTIFLKQATVMRQTIGNAYQIFEPETVVTELNRRMAQQEFAGCLFATCCYGLLNIETFELRLARAGHPYPILIRNGQPHCLQSRGGLLGVFSEAQFEQQSHRLEPGDKLFVYSDGGEPLIGMSKDDGTFAFSPDFMSITEKPIEEMIAAYDQRVRRHRFGPGEMDDVTAIGLEILA